MHENMAGEGEEAYLRMIQDVLENGHERQTRNAVAKSLFGRQIAFDLKKGFPLLTTKKMFFRGIFEELRFFLSGHTDTKILEAQGVNIWRANTSRDFLDSAGHYDYEEGDMGPMYYYNVLHYGATYEGCKADYSEKGIDQLQNVIQLLLTDPFSRRIMFTAYNPMNAAEGCLYPCHSIVVQFYVRHDALENKYYVSQLMMQRSMDVVLGCPFNIASSALLSVLLCHHLNHMVKEKRYIPDMLHMMIGDHHIYDAHYGVAKEQIARIPYKFPEISVKTQRNRLEDYVYEDIEITDYCHHPALKASMIA